MKKQSGLLSEAQTKLAEFSKKPQDNGEKVDEAEKTELEARVEILKDMKKNYEDPGILLDCVVYFDGKDWRAVIDVNESGDLRGKRKLLPKQGILSAYSIFYCIIDQPCLTDYRKELKYHTFGKADLLNFSVNIYNNGGILR